MLKADTYIHGEWLRSGCPVGETPFSVRVRTVILFETAVPNILICEHRGRFQTLWSYAAHFEEQP